MKLEQKVQEVIKQVKTCAIEVYQELGDGWPEGIYHKSMEVALRLAGFPYETQTHSDTSKVSVSSHLRQPHFPYGLRGAGKKG